MSGSGKRSASSDEGRLFYANMEQLLADHKQNTTNLRIILNKIYNKLFPSEDHSKTVGRIIDGISAVATTIARAEKANKADFNASITAYALYIANKYYAALSKLNTGQIEYLKSLYQIQDPKDPGRQGPNALRRIGHMIVDLGFKVQNDLRYKDKEIISRIELDDSFKLPGEYIPKLELEISKRIDWRLSPVDQEATGFMAESTGRDELQAAIALLIQAAEHEAAAASGAPAARADSQRKRTKLSGGSGSVT